MTATFDHWKAETLELGRSVAGRYTSAFQVDGRPITGVEMQALLWWSANNGDALIDRFISFLRCWHEDE